MEPRPEIKLILSPLDKKLALLSTIFLVVMWGLTLYSYWKLPATIPVHYNAAGKADSYGNKLTLLILPIIATIIYAGLTQLCKYPHIFNYMNKITEENAQRQYTIATRMLRFMNLSILLIFSFIILSTYLTSTGAVNGLGIWFLPIALALLLLPTIVSISQSLKKKNNVV